MPNLHIKKCAVQTVMQVLYESPLSVSEIAKKLSLEVSEVYEILTGTKPLTFDILMELAFYLDINLVDLTETKHIAIEATVKFFDKAIKFDRQLDRTYNKDEINDRLTSLIGFIEYEFGRAVM